MYKGDKMTDNNEKKLAVVTGGSRGIGKECALELAKAGYDIVITYAGNDEAANKTIGELKALNVEAEAYKFDVSNSEQCKENIANEFRKIQWRLTTWKQQRDMN